MRYYDKSYEDRYPQAFFYRYRKIKRTRKPHVCMTCKKEIPTGTECYYISSFTEADDNPRFGWVHNLMGGCAVASV